MTERFLEHDWFERPLPANVELGARTWLYSTFAFVHYHSTAPLGLRVGNDTGIYNGTFFDLGPKGEVVIGDFCSIVGGIFATNSRIEIGDYSFIAHEVVLADDSFAAPPSAPPGRLSDYRPTIQLGENVWIGARAILLGDVEIGEGAVIGAAAVVRGQVPPMTIFAGNPARQVGVVRRKTR
jgi:acetyltransferase-like isoleucine patch superfamily enzyme